MNIIPPATHESNVDHFLNPIIRRRGRFRLPQHQLDRNPDSLHKHDQLDRQRADCSDRDYPRLKRKSALVGDLQQNPSLDLHRSGQPGDVIDGNVLLGSLDGTEIGPVQPGFVRKAFLRPAALRPKQPKVSRKHVSQFTFGRSFHKRQDAV